MSGTVNYPKVIEQLTDVIKELNVPCGEAAPAAPSEETRRADAVDLLKALLGTLESGASDAAAAEHSARGDRAVGDDGGKYRVQQENARHEAAMKQQNAINAELKAQQTRAPRASDKHNKNL
jgi:hypothetical protein